MRLGFLYYACLGFIAFPVVMPSIAHAQDLSSVATTIRARSAPRVGLMIGRMYSSTEYVLFDEPAREEDEIAGVLGISVEQPLTTMLSLCLQAQLTFYGSALLFASKQDPGGVTTYIGFNNQRWMVELPLLLKVSFNSGRLRPWLAAGPMLAVATPPEDFTLNRSGPEGWSWESLPLPGYHGGVVVSAGTELAVSGNVALSLDAVMTQLFASPLDLPEISQRNTPRFQFRFGVVFPLDAEEWK